MIAGFNITCVGDNRSYSFLPTRKNNTLSDKVGLHVLKNIDQNFKTYSWKDRGSDERQYCAPLIDLPIASIMRTKYGEYIEYHTSLDDLKNVVTPEGLCGGYNAIKLSIEAIENNYIYKTQVYGEPQMSKRGLYPEISKKSGINYDTQLIMDVLSQCDGISDLISISERCDVPIWEIYDIIKLLLKHDLIRPVKDTN